jgi:microcystin degradation protein MlrC
VFEKFWSEFETFATKEIAQGIDAIYLVLHGGMCTETIRDPEGEFLSRIRSLPGAADLPIFGVFDLHANLSLRTFQLAQSLVSYRNNPHNDSRETAMRAAQIMASALATKRIPRTLGCQIPLLLPPPATGTDDDPMKALEARARQLEIEHPEILVINIVGGFAFADSRDTGVSVSAIHHGNDKLARAVLTEIADLAWSMKEKAVINYPTAEELLGQIQPDPQGPTLLVEPADNIGGGAPGDCTGVLRAFLKHGTKNALLSINDPEAVASLADAQPGETRTLALGGKGSRLDPGPVELTVTFVSRSDGKFTLVDRNSHLASMGGVNIDMQDSAVVRTDNLTILITSRKTPPFDLGQYRSQGIEPKDFAFIGVKAAVGHRQGYDPITAQSYWVDTPGPCRSELTSFPWQELRRPIYPLDPIEEPEYNFS